MKKELISLESCKKNITIERLQQDLDNVIQGIDRYSSDYISYPVFLRYFANLEKITKDNVIIAINFTYGWMPTIFDFRSDISGKVIDILNEAKKGIVPTVSGLEILRKCFNNSLVGTSKLLHFINPEKFAIWDSRVFRYLTNQEPYSYRLDNYDLFLDYLKFCEFVISNNEYNKIHNSIVNKVGYPMTKFRTLELLMYLKGVK